jgi:hypothetical protein
MALLCVPQSLRSDDTSKSTTSEHGVVNTNHSLSAARVSCSAKSRSAEIPFFNPTLHTLVRYTTSTGNTIECSRKEEHNAVVNDRLHTVVANATTTNSISSTTTATETTPDTRRRCSDKLPCIPRVVTPVKCSSDTCVDCTPDALVASITEQNGKRVYHVAVFGKDGVGRGNLVRSFNGLRTLQHGEAVPRFNRGLKQEGLQHSICIEVEYDDGEKSLVLFHDIAWSGQLCVRQCCALGRADAVIYVVSLSELSSSTLGEEVTELENAVAGSRTSFLPPRMVVVTDDSGTHCAASDGMAGGHVRNTSAASEDEKTASVSSSCMSWGCVIDALMCRFCATKLDDDAVRIGYCRPLKKPTTKNTKRTFDLSAIYCTDQYFRDQTRIVVAAAVLARANNADTLGESTHIPYRTSAPPRPRPEEFERGCKELEYFKYSEHRDFLFR